MIARQLFLISSELLGVNFRRKFDFKAFAILIFHFSFAAHNLHFFITMRVKSQSQFSIYSVIIFVQDENLVLCHFLFLVRSFSKRKLQRRISETILTMKKVSKVKIELKFVLRAAIIIAMRIPKAMTTEDLYVDAHVKMIISELTLTSNDFMFVYFIASLTANLKSLKSELTGNSNSLSERAVHDEIIKNFETKRDIQNRYSTDLFISIFYNFIQLIIDLYYMCMRIIFGTFRTPQSEKKVLEKLELESLN